MAIGVYFQAIRPPRRKPLIQPLRSKLDRLTKKTAQDLMETVQRYPPPPATSNYQRTERLLGNWALVPMSNQSTVQWLLENHTPYANLVHGPIQWPPHRWNGWRNIREVTEAYHRSGRFQIAAQNIITEGFGDWIDSKGRGGASYF